MPLKKVPRKGLIIFLPFPIFLSQFKESSEKPIFPSLPRKRESRNGLENSGFPSETRLNELRQEWLNYLPKDFFRDLSNTS